MAIRRWLSGGALVAGCLLAGAATARAQVLTFEGLQDQESVDDFYNGGLGSLGSGPGPNFGINFTSNSLALIESSAGGNGNFGDAPSGHTVLFFLTGSAIMNVSAGFSTGFSFFYSSPFFTGTVNVYDGLNGTGTLLASLDLAMTPDGSATCASNPGQHYCIWNPVGVTFSGTARSVDFGGTVNHIGFDDITVNSATPGTPNSTVPEPITMTLLGTGLAAVGVARRRRRRTATDA